MAAPITLETLHDQLNKLIVAVGELSAKHDQQQAAQDSGAVAKPGGTKGLPMKTAFDLLFCANPGFNNIPVDLIKKFTKTYMAHMKAANQVVFDAAHEERYQYLIEQIATSDRTGVPIADLNTFNDKRLVVLSAIATVNGRTAGKTAAQAWYTSPDIISLVGSAQISKASTKGGKAAAPKSDLSQGTLDAINNSLSWGDSAPAGEASNGTHAPAPVAAAAATTDNWNF